MEKNFFQEVQNNRKQTRKRTKKVLYDFQVEPANKADAQLPLEPNKWNAFEVSVKEMINKHPMQTSFLINFQAPFYPLNKSGNYMDPKYFADLLQEQIGMQVKYDASHHVLFIYSDKAAYTLDFQNYVKDLSLILGSSAGVYCGLSLLLKHTLLAINPIISLGTIGMLITSTAVCFMRHWFLPHLRARKQRKRWKVKKAPNAFYPLHKWKRTYLFRRTLNGAKFGKHRINEKRFRKVVEKLQTGDLVEVDGTHRHLKVIGHDKGKETAPIKELTMILVEYSNELKLHVARRYANGDLIVNEQNQPVTVILNPDETGIKTDDVIDYAFYQSHQSFTNRDAIHGKVRWHYPMQNGLSQPARLTKSQRLKNSKKRKANVKRKQNDQVVEIEDEGPLLAMDLKGQSVVIISGSEHMDNVISMVEAYHGHPNIINGKILGDAANPMFEKVVESADIVIVCIDSISHLASQTANSVIKDKVNAKYAISNSSSKRFVERAIYRAENHLQAYDTNQSTIEYQERNKDR